jgi:hypothetical protein
MGEQKYQVGDDIINIFYSADFDELISSIGVSDTLEVSDT